MTSPTATHQQGLGYDEEGLGDDYMLTPWLQPSVERALRHAHAKQYRRGRAPYCGTSTGQLGELGVGISLYFRFLKYLACIFFLMSVFAAPALMFSYVGTRIQEDDMDAIGISRTTIGNFGQGVNGYVDCEVNVANCSALTVIQVGDRTFKVTSAAYLISAGDFFGTLILLLGYFFIKGRIKATVEDVDIDHVTASQYAVFVRRLPKDATEEEIRRFFSNLYRLDKDDVREHWCCCKDAVIRPAPRDPPVRPVSDCSNTSDRRYLGGWVAEVAVAHFTGSAIDGLIALRKDAKRLRLARARVKKYAKSTPLRDKFGRSGYDQAKMDKALAKLRQIEIATEKIRQSVLAWDLQQAAQRCEAAFVIFDHPISAQRCIADYHGSKTALGRCCQPRHLRFRGKHRIRVDPAPNTSDVLWENLGVSLISKYSRRAFTLLFTISLLVLSFIVILAAQDAKEAFAKGAPSFSDCNSHVYASVFDRYVLTERPEDVIPKLYRDREQTCPDGMFFVWYEGEEAQAMLNNASRPAEWWEEEQESCVSPCMAPASELSCEKLACSSAGQYWRQQGVACDSSARTYSAHTRVGCYCKQVLSQKLAETDVISAARELIDEELDLCGDFAEAYAASQSLTLAAAVAVIFVNVLLKAFLGALVRFERHSSVSSQARNLSIKLFVAQFLNTAILTLIVYARLPNNIEFPLQTTISLFDGQFDDFDSRWYSAVGAAIAVTVIFNAFVPTVTPLVQYYLLAKCKRKCCAGRAATQDDLDQYFVGPNFNIAVQHSLILNTSFACLFYGGGMPILLPIACLAFVFMYLLDKYTLLRVYSLPPNFDESLTRDALHLLRYAILAHLAISAWMYGNNDVLRSELVTSSVLTSNTGGAINEEDAAEVALAYNRFVNETAPYDPLSIGPKVLRANVFPLFLLWLVVFLWVLYGWIRAIVGPILKVFVGRIIRVLTCGLFCVDKAKVSSESEAYGMHKYTGVFGMYVDGRSRLTQDEIDRGWILVQEGDYKVKYLTWPDSEPDALGIRHEPGSFKLTWQKIMENSPHSYHMAVNPKYRKLAMTWNEMSPEMAKARRMQARARAAAHARAQAEKRNMEARRAMELAKMKQDREEMMKLQAEAEAAEKEAAAAQATEKEATEEAVRAEQEAKLAAAGKSTRRAVDVESGNGDGAGDGDVTDALGLTLQPGRNGPAVGADGVAPSATPHFEGSHWGEEGNPTQGSGKLKVLQRGESARNFLAKTGVRVDDAAGGAAAAGAAAAGAPGAGQ